MNVSPVDSIPRDVRTDPQPGDMVSKTNAKGRKNLRTVVAVLDHYVHYIGSKTPVPCVCWISTWTEWCRGATVEKAV